MVADGRLILCNERYVQMYGLSPELTRAGRLAARSDRPPHQGRQLLRQPRPVHRRPAQQHRQGQDRHQRARARGPLHRHRQPADGRRRLGRDPRGHHRAADGRTAALLDAGAGKPARRRSKTRSRASASASRACSRASATAPTRCNRPRSACWARRSRPRSAPKARSRPRTRHPPTSRPRPPPPHELSSSIAEISQQLGRTTEVVRVVGERGRNRPTIRSPAWPRPRRRSATWSS